MYVHVCEVSIYRIDDPHNRGVLAAVHAEMCEHDEGCNLKTIKSNIPAPLTHDFTTLCFGYLPKEPVPEVKGL